MDNGCIIALPFYTLEQFEDFINYMRSKIASPYTSQRERESLIRIVTRLQQRLDELKQRNIVASN
jgi:hypothetical protein